MGPRFESQQKHKKFQITLYSVLFDIFKEFLEHLGIDARWILSVDEH